MTADRIRRNEADKKGQAGVEPPMGMRVSAIRTGASRYALET
jgi:hypothetical protein